MEQNEEATMRGHLPVLWTILLAGCTAGIGDRSSAIVGGTADPGDTSVVAIVGSLGQSTITCSGFVAAPTVVVTGAGCFAGLPTPDPRQWSVFLGDRLDLDGGAASVPVAAIHPDPRFDPRNLQGGHDVAVLIVQSPLGVPALPIRSSPLPTTAVGTLAKVVGYGTTAPTMATDGGFVEAGAGLRREVMAPITAVNGPIVWIGDAGHTTCDGDAGAPAIMMDPSGPTVIGTLSFGPVGCTNGSGFTAPETIAAFVGGFLANGASDAGAVDAGAVDAGAAADLARSAPSPTGCAYAAAPRGGGSGLALVLLALVVLLRRKLRAALVLLLFSGVLAGCVSRPIDERQAADAVESCAADELFDAEAGYCGVDDAPGACKPVPVDCYLSFDPVCGCDGKTYGNDCVRQSARVQLDHPGKCPAR